MPSLVLESSPLAGGKSVTISYRREGEGPAFVFLHGGWGYDIYPLDTATLSAAHTVVIPSRSGYGRSSSLDHFPPDFHYGAALETLTVLDALGIERAVWWGHSDGAVIAAMAAIHAPDRVDAVILEALHYFAAKPRSRSFFQRMAFEPETFSEGIRTTLAAEHGAQRWGETVRHDGQAWLDLAREAPTEHTDLYAGRLHEIDEISTPTLIVHGGGDPRTEPGELEAILDALPHAQLSFHAEAGHCPHAESSREAVTASVLEFLSSLAAPGGSGRP
jgi:pimeloyl-ACP methyl ester carboxylesterase